MEDWRTAYSEAAQRETALRLTSENAAVIAFPMPHAIYGVIGNGRPEYFVCYTKEQETRLLKSKRGKAKPMIVTRGWAIGLREWPNEDGEASPALGSRETRR